MTRLDAEQIAEIRARDERWAVPLTMYLREVNSPFHAVEDRRKLLEELDARADVLVEFLNVNDTLPEAWKHRLVEAFGLEVDLKDPDRHVRRG